MNGSKVARFLIGVVFAAAGYFGLNYTNAFDIAHHTQWAAEHGFPAPSYEIFLGGAVALGLGALILGHAMAAKPAKK